MKATPRPNILRINSSTADDQQNPSIAIDERGNFVVAWQSETEEDGEEVFARFFFSGGTAFAPEILVNTFPEGDQERPAVGMDAIGNIVTTWQATDQGDAGSGIFAQRYQFTDGNVVQDGSQFRVNITTEGRQQNPDVAFDQLEIDEQNPNEDTELRDFVVVWQNEGLTTNRVIGRDDSGFGIFAQRYSGLGTPQGRAFLVNTTTDRDQINPAVAFDADGNFAVVWQSRTRSNGYDIFAQRFDSLGNPIGIQFQVNTAVNGDQINPDIAVDPSGSFVIVWQDENQDGSDIYARRYSSNGNPRGIGGFRVNSTTDGNQQTPAIGKDREGNFTVVWASDSGDNFDIIGQQFELNGKRIEGEFQVNKNTNDDQTLPQIAVRPNGNFVIAWQSDEGGDRGTDILARRYTVPQGNNSGGNGGGGGGVAPNPPRPRSRIAQAASDSDLSGSNLSGSDLVVDTVGDDLLNGGKGNDRLLGKQGRDSFAIGKGLGTETILDFQRGRDRIVLWRNGQRQADRLILKGNLQPDDLTFVPQGRNTLVQADDRILAVLRGVNLTAETSGI